MKRYIVLLLASVIILTPSWANISPRAMAMGSAFTAIADDAFAAYWNPAGLALNPGVDITAHYQANNRNQAIGDNAVAVKGCFELGMDPFTWIVGLGAASALAYEGAQYLSDQGVVKKNWGRTDDVPSYSKQQSMAAQVKANDEAQKAAGGEPVRDPISKSEALKYAAKELGKGTIHVSKELAKQVLDEAKLQTRNYYFVFPLCAPDYYRPYYWDNRYAYSEKELTPAGKAQVGGAITAMFDKNETLDQDTNWYSLSLATGYSEIAAVGANLNVYDLKVPSSGVTGLGAGFDLGGLLRFTDALSFGLVAKEILTTDIRWSNQTTSRYQMNVNAGMAIKPISMLTVAADAHNIFAQNAQLATMHYGLEFRPVYGMAFRAGMDNQNKTAGFSVGLGQLILDYAYLGGSYNRTQMIGATWKI